MTIFYDYNLWSYILSDDRDARELLLAQYYVLENADGSWSTTEETIPKPDKQATQGGQVLAAAAAYRGYLGSDISMQHGLMPVEGEDPLKKRA